MSVVSVIIPLYNRKHLIARCVRSVAAQTYRDLEIIIVDDGSTDDCDAVLESLACEDARIKLIRKENGGVSSARNAGLEAASGEYVQFVDSDDELLPSATETALAAMVEQGADAVVFGLANVSESMVQSAGAPQRFLSLADFFRFNRNMGGLCSPVNKLFRRTLIGEDRFRTDVSWGEDMIFSLNYLQKAQSFVQLPETLYIVYPNSSGSLSYRYDPNGFHDAEAQGEELAQYLSKVEDALVHRIIGSYLWLCYMECVRKLCLRSGLGRRAIAEKMKHWDSTSFVASVRAYHRSSPLDCYCLSRRLFALVPFAVRFCRFKSFVGRLIRMK